MNDYGGLTTKQIVQLLRRLAADWPKGTLMLFANGQNIYLCDKHPEAGGKVIEGFKIPNDGGDPDWTDQ